MVEIIIFGVALLIVFLLIVVVLGFVLSWKKTFIGIIIGLAIAALCFFPVILQWLSVVVPPTWIQISIVIVLLWVVAIAFFVLLAFNLYREYCSLKGKRNGLGLHLKWLNFGEKALGGNIFGDVANFVGVVAGMGAYQLATDENWKRGWWLIGQMAALLALIVGISLIWRWAISEHNERKHILPALLNLVVGYSTLGSIMWPVNDNPLILQLSTNVLRIVVVASWLLFLITAQIYLVLFLILEPKRHPGRYRWTRFWVRLVLGVLAVLLLIVGIFLVIRFVTFDPLVKEPWAWLARVLGIAGVVAWGLAELVNAGYKLWTWKHDGNWPGLGEYLSFEKSLWESIAALAIVLYLEATWRGVVKESVMGEYFVLFILGATLGLFGTVRGIVSGLVNLIHKKQRREEQNWSDLYTDAKERRKIVDSWTENPSYEPKKEYINPLYKGN